MQTSVPFSALTLSPALLESLASLRYERMTPIQLAALRPMLEGRDVIAQAKTGSGKTAAFALGILQDMNAGSPELQALVLCPTRELADQVSREIRALARSIPNVKLLTLCGGVPIRAHRESLAHGAHIVVGTPGRLRALVEREYLELTTVQVLVMDEADRMLELGFEDDLRAILKKAPSDRRTWLFSATYPAEIEQISAGYQRNPVRVTVDSEITADQLEQLFFRVGVTAEERIGAVVALLAHFRPEAALVFCNTLALHSDLEQRERDEVLAVFANRSCTVLVATDVAARGLDIADLDCVINYELAADPSAHIHRVGRTGRAGKRGLALSLHRESDSHRLQRIEQELKRPLEQRPLPPRAAASGLARAELTTLRIEGGRRDKLRAADILGALTAGDSVAGVDVGKIQVLEQRSYVAIKRSAEQRAYDALSQGRIKKRRFRVSKVNTG
jgi:ATP-independent RNA helicase DbpA